MRQSEVYICPYCQSLIRFPGESPWKRSMTAAARAFRSLYEGCSEWVDNAASRAPPHSTCGALSARCGCAREPPRCSDRACAGAATSWPRCYAAHPPVWPRCGESHCEGPRFEESRCEEPRFEESRCEEPRFEESRCEEPRFEESRCADSCCGSSRERNKFEVSRGSEATACGASVGASNTACFGRCSGACEPLRWNKQRFRERAKGHSAGGARFQFARPDGVAPGADCSCRVQTDFDGVLRDARSADDDAKRAQVVEELNALMQKEPLHIHTVILPENMDINDPRLKDARVVSRRVFYTDHYEPPTQKFYYNFEAPLESPDARAQREA